MIILSNTTHLINASTVALPSSTVFGYCSYRIRTSTTFEAKAEYSEIDNSGVNTMCSAPSGAGVQHIIDYISIFNDSNATQTVSVFWTDGSNTAVIWEGSVTSGGKVEYVEGVGWRLFGSTGTPIESIQSTAYGSNTEIQYNNSGELGSESTFTYDSATDTFSITGSSANKKMSAIATSPSAPSTGYLTQFIKKIAGLEQPFVLSSMGVESALQRALWNTHKVDWRPAAAAGVYSGTVGANLGTPTISIPTTTNIFTAMRRSNFPTVVTTTNQQVGIRTEAMFWRGNASLLGGWFMVCRMGFTSIKTACRAFVGFTSGTTAVVTVDPSTLTNMCGFGFDVGDTAWTFMHNDASGTCTKDAISGQGTLATANTGYEFYIYCKPNDSTVYYRMVRTDTMAVLCDTSATTNLPVNTTLLTAQCIGSNGTANIVAGDMNISVGVFEIYTER